MSFLSTLGHVLTGQTDFQRAGANIAGMFIPGLSAVSNVASVLGKQQQGKAKGAADQAQIQQGQDRNAISLYQAQQGAQNQAAQTDLERQQYATTNRGTTAKQALIGALLGGGYQPTSISVPGITPAHVSGGLAQSLLGSPDAIAAMKTLGSQASTAQNTPLTFTGGNLVAPPKLTALPNVGGGALSKIADAGQLIGAAGPSFLEILKQLQQGQTKPGGPVYGASSADSGYGGGF